MAPQIHTILMYTIYATRLSITAPMALGDDVAFRDLLITKEGYEPRRVCEPQTRNKVVATLNLSSVHENDMKN